MPGSLRAAARFALVFVGALSLSMTASATTRIVTSLDDASPGGLSATVAASSAGDSIAFASGLTGTITLASSPLVIAQDLTIIGPGVDGSGSDLIAIDPGADQRVLSISGATVSVSGLAILPYPPYSGGGIRNDGDLTLSRVRVGGGYGFARGGCIENVGSLVIVECEISRGDSYDGGGIHSGPGSHLQLVRSTLYYNQAEHGGGIYSDSAEVRIENSTITDNSASFDGAVHVRNGTCSISHSTIVGNRAGGMISGGAGIGIFAGTVTLRNSVVAKNINPHYPFGEMNVTGCCVEDLDFNHYAAGSVEDPLLMPWTRNGGFGRTMYPMTGSPLIDQGISDGIAVDQRGLTRPFDDVAITNAAAGDGADIGAVESTGAPVTAVQEGALGNGSRITSVVPNPSPGVTSVAFDLARPGNARLVVHAVDGRHVRTLWNGWRSAGKSTTRWDGRDERGLRQPAGFYLVTLRTGGTRVTRGLVLAR